MVTNSSLTVRPSKIIAGQEPEKTNELLQQIGKALQQNLSSKEAVLIIKDKSGKTIVSSRQIKNTENSKTSSKSTLNVKQERPRREVANPKRDKSPKEKSKTKTDPKDKKSNPIKKGELAKKEKKGDLDSLHNKSKTLPTKRNDKNNSSRENDPVATVDFQTDEIKIETEIPENENNLKSNINSAETGNVEKTTNMITADSLERTLGPIDSVADDVSLGNDSNKIDDIAEDASQIDPEIKQEIQERQEIIITDSEKNEVDSETKQDNIEQVTGLVPNESLANGIDEKKFIPNLIIPDKKEEKVNDRAVRSGRKIERVEILKKSKSAEKKSDDESIDQKLSRSSNDSESIRSAKSRNLLRPPSVRPSSARPGAPRLRERATDVIIKTAEPTTVGKVNVIIENYDNQQEHDEESLVVIQDTLETNVVEANTFNSEEISSGHGHLVQQILDTQKKLVHDDNAKTEIEWEYGARREREALYKEVDSIKVGLQSLSRAANPIGVLMDHVQEDVEVMRQELMLWRDSYQNSATALTYQQGLTEQEVQVLLQKLKQLDVSILEQTDQIHTVKLSIHRNSERIKKLIDGDDHK